jgi:surface antigen
MRIRRTVTVAFLVAVTFLSLGAATRTLAQPDPGVAVRMEALDALLAESTPLKTPKSRHATHESAPVHVAFVDEDTPWIAPPAPPPEEFQTDGVLQCVPYARFMSGIGLRGDAWTWWDKAAGIYARGNYPEPGAILSFPGNDRMPLGHVAVVTQVLSPRKILIDHANWPNAVVQHGAISRDIQVADVSPANDWTEVRVQFGEGGPLGSVYPANGFIYEWNEAGVRIARPRFSLDYALWSPSTPSVRMFNAINYLWALPPAERKKAYADAGVVPNPTASARGRPVLVLGPVGPGLNDGTMGRILGVNRLDVGTGGRTSFMTNRFVMR